MNKQVSTRFFSTEFNKFDEMSFRYDVNIHHNVEKIDISFIYQEDPQPLRDDDSYAVWRLQSNLSGNLETNGVCLGGSSSWTPPTTYVFSAPKRFSGDYSLSILNSGGALYYALLNGQLSVKVVFYESANTLL